MITLKTAYEVECIKKSCKVATGAVKLLEEIIKPGITTIELNNAAVQFIRQNGGTPSFKGYKGYPADICTSINEEVVHGIPSEKALKIGDIISIDIGVVADGYFGDIAVTLPVGHVNGIREKLIKVTKESLDIGIKEAIIGNRVGNISSVIQTFVESHGFNVVRDFVGHGIGRAVHEEPQVPNFGEKDHGARLKSGMIVCIEPMVNIGTWEVKVLKDGWTVVTKDGNLSAHFEHTVLITENGPQVLTE